MSENEAVAFGYFLIIRRYRDEESKKGKKESSEKKYKH